MRTLFEGFKTSVLLREVISEDKLKRKKNAPTDELEGLRHASPIPCGIEPTMGRSAKLARLCSPPSHGWWPPAKCEFPG
jgi:hypothetical protein